MEGRDWKGLVVIVDSLDHNRAVDSEKFQQVRRALVNLFDKDYQNIRLARCHTVFTLPLYVQVASGAMRRVTNIKVRGRDGEVDENGVDALRALLRLRVPGGDLTRLLPSEKAERELVLASGGHLRILLMLAMEVEIQAESLPVDEATVRVAIDQVRNGMLPIADDERELLRRVARDQDVPLSTQERWDVASRLLDQHFVLGYQNGDTWYDVHPLLADEIRTDEIG